MRKEMIEEVTLLRGLAFLAITLQHCIGEYIYRTDIEAQDSIMLAMLFHFTRYGTPTFVFLSGLILFYNYYEKLNYVSFMKKRFTDIVVPFVIWTVIYWIFAKSGRIFSAEALTELGKQLILPTHGYHLWFITMIFQFYALFPVFVWGVKCYQERILAKLRDENVERAVIWTIAAGGVLFGVLLWLSYYVIPGMPEGIWKSILQFRDKYVPFHLFYFLIGAVAALGLPVWRSYAARLLLASAILFAGMYVWLGYEVLSHSMERMNLNVATYLKPSTFVLIAVQLFLLYGFTVIVKERGGIVRRALMFIGTYSFGGFLAHALILGLAAGFTRPMQLAGYHLHATVLTFLFVAAASIALAKLLSLLPFGKWLIGSLGPINDRPHGKPQSSAAADLRRCSEIIIVK
ncbi:acyltransferase [Paenibacillus alkalitolerans]|uniref:acyltransferase n=1 Tax=Paenibacillus alkalitolerans TaxID=2799335 RepID=UPI0018F4D84E|nr:acyltransferase [Paenibacillus alkalitolerans]